MKDALALVAAVAMLAALALGVGWLQSRHARWAVGADDLEARMAALEERWARTEVALSVLLLALEDRGCSVGGLQHDLAREVWWVHLPHPDSEPCGWRMER